MDASGPIGRAAAISAFSAHVALLAMPIVYHKFRLVCGILRKMRYLIFHQAVPLRLAGFSASGRRFRAVLSVSGVFDGKRDRKAESDKVVSARGTTGATCTCIAVFLVNIPSATTYFTRIAARRRHERERHPRNSGIMPAGRTTAPSISVA